MLISSPRHTDDDLRVWAQRVRYDALLGARIAPKVERALDAIQAFAKAGPCYAGVSWGKDSVALAHLLWSSKLKIPIAWMRWEPMSNPDCLLVRDDFIARFPIDYREIQTSWVRQGRRWVNEADPSDRDGFGAARTLGSRYISGVRAAESRARKIRCAVWGESSPNTCAPLARWSVEDVFGYLALHDLPIHPAYAMTMGGAIDRADVRVDCLGGMTGTGRGRREWEWTYYRDELIALGEDLRVA